MVQMTEMQREHISNWVIIPAIFGFLIPSILVVFGVLWYEPHPIANFHREAWPTEVRAGETINIKASVLRSKSGCASLVTRVWYDDLGRVVGNIQTFESPEIEAGNELYTSRAVVPREALPGKIVLRTTVDFRCNFVQGLIGGTDLPLHDIVFTVLP